MEFGVAFHLADLFFHGFSALKLPIRGLKVSKPGFLWVKTPSISYFRVSQA